MRVARQIIIWVFLLSLGQVLGVSAQAATLPAKQSIRSAVATGRININTADVETLTFLQGIGEKKAQAIISYRKKHGPFATFDQLMEVKGIGPAIVAKNRAVIVFN